MDAFCHICEGILLVQAPADIFSIKLEQGNISILGQVTSNSQSIQSKTRTGTYQEIPVNSN